MPKFGIILLAIGILGLFTFLVNRHYTAAHRISDAEDRRRWLRETDRANAETGIIKDTNGDFVYVGVTNALTWWSNQSSSK